MVSGGWGGSASVTLAVTDAQPLAPKSSTFSPSAPNVRWKCPHLPGAVCTDLEPAEQTCPPDLAGQGPLRGGPGGGVRAYTLSTNVHISELLSLLRPEGTPQGVRLGSAGIRGLGRRALLQASRDLDLPVGTCPTSSVRGVSTAKDREHRPCPGAPKERPVGRQAGWEALGAASSRWGVWVLCPFGGDAEESLLGGLFRLGVTLDPFLVPELGSALR